MNDNHTLSVFTPSNTAPEDLEFILVQRHDLLQDAVERVRESALTDNKHHLLFVGPRGCGKTHLITLIVHRVGQDEELADRLRVAWLNEDETCTNLLELLIKIHGALEKRYPEEYKDEALSAAFEMKPDDALEFVAKRLLESLGSCTLMVAAENLDAIFENLGSAGQKQLRAFIQENPRLSLIATAQKLVESLSNRNNPFYGFFQTEHLKPLNVDEATELLRNISRLRGNQEVVEFLSTSRGRARLQALHHLSGGNHRIYIVLSQFITRDSVDALIGPFMKMVDELTPYYQERVRWLPAQQRKIVEYLCACETTVPVKDIAKRLFATQQTISSQLKDLREKGYVESNQSGRESLYEISEPLMRICLEVKGNQRHQPLRLLVDFLRVWYDERELTCRLDLLKPEAVARAYLESAIARNKAEGNLRTRLILEDALRGLSEVMTPSERRSFAENYMDLPEVVALVAKFLIERNFSGAIGCATEAIKDADDVDGKFYALVARATFHRMFGSSKEAINDYTEIIEMEKRPSDSAVFYRYYRGICYLNVDLYFEAGLDFAAVVAYSNSSNDKVVESYMALAGIQFREGKWDKGFEFIEAALKKGKEIQPANFRATTGPLKALFSNGLDPESRRTKVAQLFRIYQNYQGLSSLGDGLLKHLGELFRSGQPYPFSKDLKQWSLIWEQAAMGNDDFRLPLRLLRTGTDFLIAGGKDEGIILRLTSAEREILKQAFGFVEKKRSK